MFIIKLCKINLPKIDANIVTTIVITFRNLSSIHTSFFKKIGFDTIDMNLFKMVFVLSHTLLLFICLHGNRFKTINFTNTMFNRKQ